MSKFYKEFKEFAVKGNMMDMAIGIIIGGAFSKIVSSLVSDIIMPLFGYYTGEMDYSEKKTILQEAVIGEDGKVIREAITINYGQFLQYALDFLIVAFSIFLVIKVLNSIKRKAEEPGNKTTPTPKDIQLLSEIRDLMKEERGVK